MRSIIDVKKFNIVFIIQLFIYISVSCISIIYIDSHNVRNHLFNNSFHIFPFIFLLIMIIDSISAEPITKLVGIKYPICCLIYLFKNSYSHHSCIKNNNIFSIFILFFDLNQFFIEIHHQKVIVYY